VRFDELHPFFGDNIEVPKIDYKSNFPYLQGCQSNLGGVVVEHNNRAVTNSGNNPGPKKEVPHPSR
jgi:hypothetical protein